MVSAVRSPRVVMVSVVRLRRAKVASAGRLHLVGIVRLRRVAMASVVRLRRAKVESASRLHLGGIVRLRRVKVASVVRLRRVRVAAGPSSRLRSRLGRVARSLAARASGATGVVRRVVSAGLAFRRRDAARGQAPDVAALPSVVPNKAGSRQARAALTGCPFVFTGTLI